MQTTINVELFSAPTNNAVIRMPGRHYPGVLIQGDTLASLLDIAREIEALVDFESGSQLADRVIDLRKRLESMVSWYEERMIDAGLTLPYKKKGTETG